MSEQVSADVSSDDRLWAALAYVFSPIIPIIIMLMEDKKDRPFIRAHNAQALVWGILMLVSWTFLSWIIVGACIGFVGFLIQLYWAYKAYSGEMVNIPVVSDFVRNQGWA